MDLGIAGRRAVVAASSKGLGFAAAEVLAREGVTVAICSRDPAQIEAAAVRIGPNALPMVADVGTLQRLPGIIGKGQVAELAFSGDDFGAERDRKSVV